MSEKISFADVMSILNISKLKQVGDEVYFPCPTCGRRDKASYNEAKCVAHCFKCDKSWNPVTLYGEFTGLHDNKEAFSSLMKNLERGGRVHMTPPTVQTVHEESLAPIEQRDKVYKTMFKLLGLDAKHREDLKSRGLEKGPFRTLDIHGEPEGVAFCQRLQAAGCDLHNVPPFYFSPSDGYWHMTLPCHQKGRLRGIIVPYYDIEGRIQGLQLRKDNDLLRRFPDGSQEPKYTWLSARRAPAEAEYAAGAKTFTGMMCQWKVGLDGQKCPDIPKGVIYLTEGAMKAYIAHSVSGLPFVAVPGVQSYRFLRNTLKSLKAMGVTKVVQAYDMDYLTNPNVQDAVKKTEAIIRDLGLSYQRWDWHTMRVTLPDGSQVEGALKGIDDACVYYYKGIIPRDLVKMYQNHEISDVTLAAKGMRLISTAS